MQRMKPRPSSFALALTVGHHQRGRPRFSLLAAEHYEQDAYMEVVDEYLFHSRHMDRAYIYLNLLQGLVVYTGTAAGLLMVRRTLPHPLRFERPTCLPRKTQGDRRSAQRVDEAPCTTPRAGTASHCLSGTAYRSARGGSPRGTRQWATWFSSSRSCSRSSARSRGSAGCTVTRCDA